MNQDATNLRSQLSIVAFVDILGIGSLMKNNYSVAADKIEDLQDQIATTLRNFTSLTPEIRSFSDSIFIYQTLQFIVQRSVQDLVSFCTFISTLMSNCLREELPLCGAISIGRLITRPRNPISNARFLSGRAVWEIVDWEKRQNWIGIVFIPSEIVQEDNDSSLYYTRTSYYSIAIQILQERNLIETYDLPLSGFGIRSETENTADEGEVQTRTTRRVSCLKWPNADCENNIQLIEQIIQQLGNDSLTQKYENTMRFMQYCTSGRGDEE